MKDRRSVDDLTIDELERVLAELPYARLIASHDLEMILELCSRAILLDGEDIVAVPPQRLRAQKHQRETGEEQKVDPPRNGRRQAQLEKRADRKRDA